VLREIAPGTTVEEVLSKTGATLAIADDLSVMPV
jgi:acyl CoA:acetate/3-ketoacid CoA transferase beta subunit